MKNLVILILITTLIGCSKNTGYKEPTCNWYVLISEKYTLDTVFIQRDTLWGRSGQYTYACGKDLDSCKAYKPKYEQLCIGTLTLLERLRYVIGKH